MQDTVAEHVDLIGVDRAHELGPFAAGIAERQPGVRGKLALDREVVVLHIGGPQILIEREQVLGVRACSRNRYRRKWRAGGFDREDKV